MKRSASDSIKESSNKKQKGDNLNSIIVSSSAGSIAKKATPKTIKLFGLNIDKFRVINSEPKSVMKDLFNDRITSTYLLKIKKRSDKEKAGENHSCAPINNHLFLDGFFETHMVTWNTNTSRMTMGGVITHKDKHLGEPKGTFTKEKEENIFYYYMEAILNDRLKPDQFVKILSTVINGLNGKEIFRLEAKEFEDDFSKYFLKVIMLSLRQCLVFMELLYDSTGYIYPIRAPSMENAGGKYRLSMTCVLPKPLMYYLRFKENGQVFSEGSLNVKNLVEFLEPSAPKSNTDSNSENTSKTEMECSNSNANIDSNIESPTKSESSASDSVNCEDTLKKSAKLKANILKRFIPPFLQEADICVDNSSVFGEDCVKWNEQNLVNAFEVKTQKDLEVLVHNCSCMISYINKLFCFLHRELGISDENIKMEQFEELNGIEFNFNPFEYRFKHKDSTARARSNIYLVERFDGKNWEPCEFVKEFIGERGPVAHTSEKKFNKLVINTDPSHYILPFTISKLASECEIGISEKDLLEFLYQSCIALNKLHSVNWVHGDIKPAHLRERDGKVYLIDFEFSQEVGNFILGFTKGYHPPEYDTKTCSSRVTLQGDIYSLGISVLHILFRKDKKSMHDINLESNTIHATSFVKDLEQQNKQQDLELESDKGDNSTSFRKGLEQLEKEELMEIRNNIQSYLEKINCPILRDVLTRMTESKPEERIQNAGQIVNLLKTKNLITSH